MPVSTEAPRCSEFARSIDLLPPGSGLFLERVILVAVPLPWPKPALNHAMLFPLAPMVNVSEVVTRLFAMEPTTDDIAVEVYERSEAAVTTRRWHLGDTHLLLPLITAIADCAVGLLDDIAVMGIDRGTTPHVVPPTFLVCTQGSHDVCCGESGVALADEIQASRSDYVVRRVSHTGGHRFAPTLLALPTGRMWAFADLDLVDRVATATTTAHDHVHRARGWWGAKVGPAQVAENAVRSERPDLATVPASVQALDAGDDQPDHRFEVTVGELTWQVDVRVDRTVPSIACESAGGLPAKPGREFAWTIARR